MPPPLLHTFELYLRDEEGSLPRFEPLTCPPEEVLTTVRQMISERGLHSIEVRQMGRSLYMIRG